MLPNLKRIRTEETRIVGAAFFTLGVAMTALVLVRVLRQARGGGWLVGSLIVGSAVTFAFWLSLSPSAVAGMLATIARGLVNEELALVGSQVA